MQKFTKDYTPLGTLLVDDKEVKYYFEVPKNQIRNSKIITYSEIVTNYNLKRGSNFDERYNKWLAANNDTFKSLVDSTKDKFSECEKSIKYQGLFSDGAKKNLRKRIDILVQVTPVQTLYSAIKKRYFKHTLSFLTLTIPDNTKVNPSIIKKQLLDPFLDWLRKSHKLEFYIWKLEYQSRGSLHYHIIFPNWIAYHSLKVKWNYLLDKYNYIEDYKKQYNNVNPPSLWINKIDKGKEIGEYMEKEFIKSLQNENKLQLNKINAYKRDLERYNTLSEELKNQTEVPKKPLSFKIWDCSLNLKSSSYFTIDETQELEDNTKHYSRLKFLNTYTIFCDRCIIQNFGEQYQTDILPQKERKNYEVWKQNIINYVRKVNQNQ